MSDNVTIPIGLQKPNPGLKDLLDIWKVDVMRSLNCHAIAVVDSTELSDTGLQTVQATLVYGQTYFEPVGNGTYKTVIIPAPTLVDVPVVILGGGSTTLTFPIEKGDECLILFNDVDLGNWFSGANSGPVATPIQHGYSNGLAIVGFPRITGLTTNHAVLSNGNAEVGVPATTEGIAGGLVRIANSTSTLGQVLVQLVGVLETLTATMASATPATVVTNIAVPSATANAALLETVTALQALLE